MRIQKFEGAVHTLHLHLHLLHTHTLTNLQQSLQYESNSAIDVQNLVAFLFGFYLKATKTS